MLINLIKRIIFPNLRVYGIHNFNIYEYPDIYHIYAFYCTLLDYSIAFKDIKAFFLFLYLHDNLQLKNPYFLNKLCILYAYDPDFFRKKDLEHYLPIENHLDMTVYEFLNENMLDESNNRYFLRKHSTIKFEKSYYIKLFRIIGRFIVLYRQTLHNRYKPGGKGYLEALKRWNNNDYKI